MDQNQGDGQHPPMSGNDELAKALQFEETPAGGGGDDPAPSLAAAPQMGDPLAGVPLPPLPAVDEPVKPADEEKKEESSPDPNLPSVHHTHQKGDHTDHHKDDEAPALAPSLPSPVHDDVPPDHDHDSTGNPALDKIKNSALEELKPLVGKLNLSPEEKFDTLLLIIRSTDDHSLLDEAHDAAKNISDETKRAQALLDIIKEVDYFSTKR